MTKKNLIKNLNFFLDILKAVYVLASIGYQSESRKVFKPGSNNLFNAVRLRSVRMLARAHNITPLVRGGLIFRSVEKLKIKKPH